MNVEPAPLRQQHQNNVSVWLATYTAPWEWNEAEKHSCHTTARRAAGDIQLGLSEVGQLGLLSLRPSFQCAKLIPKPEHLHVKATSL